MQTHKWLIPHKLNFSSLILAEGVFSKEFLYHIKNHQLNRRVKEASPRMFSSPPHFYSNRGVKRHGEPKKTHGGEVKTLSPSNSSNQTAETSMMEWRSACFKSREHALSMKSKSLRIIRCRLQLHLMILFP